ncbi:hypothetical protein BS47DRAFT_729350 [Hydnum rufescens UP504]|uniref:Uncharacterized protein n=1 Tax=Hydnum rufescens UP504 TaxID=1448309 RepID=A0A9P6B1Z3_9AGAM|nr:hypothetical protein BS47DRAFT_729350 [Hydnum rufescens UP504]
MHPVTPRDRLGHHRSLSIFQTCSVLCTFLHTCMLLMLKDVGDACRIHYIIRAISYSIIHARHPMKLPQVQRDDLASSRPISFMS